MAKLPDNLSETTWLLKRQLSDVMEEARAAEFVILERYGETERTVVYLDELQSIAEQATERFSQISNLQIRIYNVQPRIPPDILELLKQVIASTEVKIPALQRSIQEIKIDWRLP